MLWNGSILEHSKRVSKCSGDYSVVDAYKVQYKKWNNRFVEWVKPSRVVEPSDHNRLLQVNRNGIGCIASPCSNSANDIRFCFNRRSYWTSE